MAKIGIRAKGKLLGGNTKKKPKPKKKPRKGKKS